MEGDEGRLVLAYTKSSWISTYGPDIGVEEGIMLPAVERGGTYHFCCSFFVQVQEGNEKVIRKEADALRAGLNIVVSI